MLATAATVATLGSVRVVALNGVLDGVPGMPREGGRDLLLVESTDMNL